MFCPACGAEMELSEVNSFEVEVCPQCRGVWLDQGELEDIIDRAIENYLGLTNRQKATHNSRSPERRFVNEAAYEDYDEFTYRQKQKKKSKRRIEREHMF